MNPPYSKLIKGGVVLLLNHRIKYMQVGVHFKTACVVFDDGRLLDAGCKARVVLLAVIAVIFKF